MKKTSAIKLSTLLLILSFFPGIQGQTGGNFTITQSVVAGGGGQQSAGGTFSLDGTIGQSIAGGASSGSPFSVTSGFWNFTPSAPNTSSAYEADINPRPAQTGNPVPGKSGDGIVTSGDVTQIRRFALGLDTPDAPPNTANEFQKADCAPLSSLGDGIIASGDVTQARRYALGLDALQLTGSSLAGDLFEPKTMSNSLGRNAIAAAQVVRAEAVAQTGNVLTVAIVLNADSPIAAANSLSFTLNFVGKELRNPTNIRLGSGAGGASLGFNGTQTRDGRLGLLLDLPPMQSFGSGMQQLALIDFTVVSKTAAATMLSFGDLPTSRFVSDVSGESLSPMFADGTVGISGANAETVSVSGRAVTAQGKGIGNVIISMTDSIGNIRTTLTDASGEYRFTNVSAGETYTFSAAAKRFTFNQPSQVMNINDETDGINFIGTLINRMILP